MSACKLTAGLRYGAFCALTSLLLLSSALASAGTALVISGTPPATATVGSAYSFQPTVSDPSGRAVSFTIYNKPSWATFSTTTGKLSGTPSAANIGTYRWVQIEGSDGQTNSWLPSYTLTVSAASSSSTGGGSTGSGSTGGSKLVVSGSPPTSATVGALYSFQPTASVPTGTTVTYEIYNKPSWATFSTTTGKLSGTPAAANIGTYRWIQIAGVDGGTTSWLPSYTLTVSAASGTTPPATGSATLSWIPPTENANGSVLTNLAGYHIYYGTSASNLNEVIDITNPGLTDYVVSDLSATTWYFAMTAINSSGQESVRSAVVTHVVP